MKYPKVSIIIATSNSEKILSKTLKSIRKQTYPQKKIEVLVIDGKSSDQTRNIAKEFNCTIIDNPKIGFTYAKQIGLLKASGRYAVFLDSDEEIENPDSLKIKLSTFKKNPMIKGVFSSGYKNPPNGAAINRYINECGDPFSLFIYRETINSIFFLNQLKERYTKVDESSDFVILDFSKHKVMPLLELSSIGSLVDLDYLRKNFPQINAQPSLSNHLFYLLNAKKVLFAVTKNDPIIHYSATSFRKYLNKISWRVKNNIYSIKDRESSGFEGRNYSKSDFFKLKKYLFIPYSFSLILPSIDGIILAIKRNDWIFLLHPFLCIYTSMLIIYYFTLNLVGIKLKQNRYGS